MDTYIFNKIIEDIKRHETKKEVAKKLTFNLGPKNKIIVSKDGEVLGDIITDGLLDAKGNYDRKLILQQFSKIKNNSRGAEPDSDIRHEPIILNKTINTARRINVSRRSTKSREAYAKDNTDGRTRRVSKSNSFDKVKTIDSTSTNKNIVPMVVSTNQPHVTAGISTKAIAVTQTVNNSADNPSTSSRRLPQSIERDLTLDGVSKNSSNSLQRGLQMYGTVNPERNKGHSPVDLSKVNYNTAQGKPRAISGSKSGRSLESIVLPINETKLSIVRNNDNKSSKSINSLENHNIKSGSSSRNFDYWSNEDDCYGCNNGRASSNNGRSGSNNNRASSNNNRASSNNISGGLSFNAIVGGGRSNSRRRSQTSSSSSSSSTSICNSNIFSLSENGSCNLKSSRSRSRSSSSSSNSSTESGSFASSYKRKNNRSHSRRKHNRGPTGPQGQRGPTGPTGPAGNIGATGASELNLPLYFNPFTINKTSTFGTFGTAQKWSGAVMATNGKIYCIPSSAESVLIIDPVMNTYDTTTISGLPVGVDKWQSGILAPNGKIYGIPANHESVLIIDPIKNTYDISTITGLSGANKWYSGSLAINGKIYCAPDTATSVLIIDPKTNTVDKNTISGFTALPNKWKGFITAPNGFLYAVPASSRSVMILDPNINVADVTTIKDLSTTPLKWDGAALANNGKIYCAPFNSPSVLIIDSATNTVDTVSLTDFEGNNKFKGIVAGHDGLLYTIPYDATYAIIIDPINNIFDITSISNLPVTNGKWSGGILSHVGRIYGVPYTSNILTIGLNYPTLPSSICLSSYFNKY